MDLSNYCSDEFWNSNLSWNSNTPRLTQCFGQIGLTILPNLLFLILIPLEIKFIIDSTNSKIQINRYNAFRYLISLFGLISNLILLINYIHDSTFSLIQNTTKLNLITVISNILIFLILTIIYHYHRLRGIITSGLIFILLFIFTITSGLIFLDTLLYNSSMYQDYQRSNILRTFLCNFSLFLLSFYPDSLDVDKKSDNIKKNVSPSEYSSFISKVTYFWCTDVIKLFSSKEIETKDIYELPDYIKVNKVTKRFFDVYYKEKENIKKKNLKSTNKTKAKFNWLTILKLMVKTSTSSILMYLFLDLIDYIVMYPKILLLDWIIAFISDVNIPFFHGIIIIICYVFILFLMPLIRNIFNMARSTLEFNIKTSLSNLVYHKSLKLSPTSRKNKSYGEIINLFQRDALRSSYFINFSVYVLMSPIQFGIGFYLLYTRLGYAAFIGLLFIILTAIFEHYFNEYKKKFYEQESEINDERLKLITETFSGIRVIKSYGWEIPFISKIQNERLKQSKLNRKLYLFQTLDDFFFSALASFSTIASFISILAVYIFFIGSDLTPQKVFFCLNVFSLIQSPVRRIFGFITQLISIKISMNRLSDFLNEDELDPYVERKYDSKMALTIKNKANFVWEIKNEDEKVEKDNIKDDIKDNNTKINDSSEKNPFRLKDIELEIKKGEFVAIIGQVGNGKSSLISAILGDMHLVENESGKKGKVNISEDQNICYVAQIPWIQNTSFKNNILFGKEFKRIEYEDVLRSCALKVDLKQLEAGDETEIGEKGINLSGGQKQRVSLARACYSSLSKNNKNQIILLDDPLSAVDAHVGKHLCENVLNSKTGLLKGSTRILVTNQINQLGDLNLDKIILLKNGEIKLNCTYDELIRMDKDGKLVEYNLKLTENNQSENREKEVQIIEEDESLNNEKINLENKMLIEEENKGSGKTELSNYYIYFKYFGYTNIVFIIIFTLFENYFRFRAKSYLGEFTSLNLNNSTMVNDTDSKKTHLLTYAGLSLFETLNNGIGSIFITMGIINCMIKFHETLLNKVLRAPMKFFDCSPIGRIINRFAEHISVVDNVLAFSIKDMTTYLFEFVSALIILIYKQPNSLPFYIFIFYLWSLVMKMYNNFSRKMKRYISAQPSNVYSHLNESLVGNGPTTIRAFNKIDEFENQMKLKFEINNRSIWLMSQSNAWMKSVLNQFQLLAIVVVVGQLILNRSTVQPGDVGLIIYYCMDLTCLLSVILTYIETFESNAISVEKINEYCQIEEEDEWIKENNRPPLDWPKKGEIEFVDYSVRYRENTKLVLKNLNFKVNGMEKIGIVGRTGAGKSTITLSLFRMIEAAEGKILIDNIDISKIGLHDLRSKLSIIPQDPILFTGTIRFNLDPFNQYQDEEIMKSLEHAHLKEFIDLLDDGILHKISEGGENLSVGQRQLICLARALLKKSKILVLDEATASVDFATDELVQKTIRSEFKDCTIITIAHRLNTVLDSNRMLVIDNGELKEYDKPDKLLNNKNSLFYQLAINTNLD